MSMKHTPYFFTKVLHRHTFIFTVFCSTLALFIVSQQQLLIAAPQDEQATDSSSPQSPNAIIKIDMSDDLGEREQQLFSHLQNNQDALLSKNSNTSDVYMQSYGTQYKETMLVLYPATRNVLYMAYPDIPNSPSITTYTDTLEHMFRVEAAEANQGFYDFFRDTGEFGASFSLRHELLFEVPFYSDELRIVSFRNTLATRSNNGSTAVIVFLLLQDGTELEQKDIFINYNEALAFIAETIAANLIQTYITEDVLSSYTRWIQEGTAPTEENYNKNIAFTQNADLLVYYDKYQVIAGSEGIIQSSIPYSTIEPFLSNTIKKLLKK